MIVQSCYSSDRSRAAIRRLMKKPSSNANMLEIWCERKEIKTTLVYHRRRMMIISVSVLEFTTMFSSTIHLLIRY